MRRTWVEPLCVGAWFDDSMVHTPPSTLLASSVHPCGLRVLMYCPLNRLAVGKVTALICAYNTADSLGSSNREAPLGLEEGGRERGRTVERIKQ